MIFTSAATTSGFSLSCGCAGITGLLPTAAPPIRMVCRIWSSVTVACHDLSV